MNEIARALLGIAVFVAIAWAVAENRRQFPIKPMAIGFASQVLLAVLLTQVPMITAALGSLAYGVDKLQSASQAGAGFVFGYLGGGTQPFVAAEGGSSTLIFSSYFSI